MNRKRVFNGLSRLLSEDDVVFCIGKELVGESTLSQFDGVCYFDDLSIDYLSIALGISMSSTKRVVVICDDSYIVKYFNTMIQISASKNQNIYVIVFRTSIYSNNLDVPSLSASIRSLKATLFNIGMLVHDYSIYFDSTQNVKKLGAILNKSFGPLIAFVDINNKRLYGGKQKPTGVGLSGLRRFILENPSGDAV